MTARKKRRGVIPWLAFPAFALPQRRPGAVATIHEPERRQQRAYASVAHALGPAVRPSLLLAGAARAVRSGENLGENTA